MDEKDGEKKPDGDIYVIGTSHESEDSYDDVRMKSSVLDPDLIAVELDQVRLERLKQTGGKIQPKSLRKSISQSKGLSLKGRLMFIVFSVFQSKVTGSLGSEFLGRDMLAGYEVSEERGIPLALVDQDISTTFNRFSSEVGVFELLKTVFYFFLSYLQLLIGIGGKRSEVDIDDFDINEIIELTQDYFPTFKQVFIDERNECMAERTAALATSYDMTVLVVGAAHKPGVVENLSNRDEVNVISESEFDELQAHQLLEMQTEE